MNRRPFLLGAVFSAVLSLFAKSGVAGSIAATNAKLSATRIHSTRSELDTRLVIKIRTTRSDHDFERHIVEIAGIKILGGSKPRQCFHQFIRPPRKDDLWFPFYGAPWFLRGDISFAQIANEFVDYVRNAHIVIHDGDFELELLDQELKAAGLQPLRAYCAFVSDTSIMAERLFGASGSGSSLEALCAHLNLTPPQKDVYHSGAGYASVVAHAYLAILAHTPLKNRVLRPLQRFNLSSAITRGESK